MYNIYINNQESLPKPDDGYVEPSVISSEPVRLKAEENMVKLKEITKLYGGTNNS